MLEQTAQSTDQEQEQKGLDTFHMPAGTVLYQEQVGPLALRTVYFPGFLAHLEAGTHRRIAHIKTDGEACIVTQEQLALLLARLQEM